MSEVINLANIQKPESDIDAIRKICIEGAASYELMHEHIPRHTRMARWLLRQPRYGSDYEERLSVLVEQQLAEIGIEREDAQVINFRTDKGEN